MSTHHFRAQIKSHVNKAESEMVITYVTCSQPISKTSQAYDKDIGIADSKASVSSSTFSRSTAQGSVK